MNDLSITVIQTTLQWENHELNRDAFSTKIDSIDHNTDLIVLPEMFSTGFSMLPEKLAEQMNGETIQWMRHKAAQKKCIIAGSLIIKDNGNYYNRLIWMKPDGSLSFYDKRHLFRMANEHKHYTAGNKQLIEQINGWRICPLICYDLRFPVWSRNIGQYDMLIYVANWPNIRTNIWNTLLKARAIENQVYVIGVNRIGKDGNGIVYSGNSQIVDPNGQTICNTKENEESIITFTFSLLLLDDFRQKFPVALDADSFMINTLFPL